MSLLVVGLSHRSAPVEVLERVTVATEDGPKLLDEMQRAEHVSEVVLLSTCNRVEVYAVVDAFHGAGFGAAAVGGEALFRSGGVGPLMPGAEHVAPYAA